MIIYLSNALSLDGQSQLRTMAYTVFPHAKAKGRKNEYNEKGRFPGVKTDLGSYILKKIFSIFAFRCMVKQPLIWSETTLIIAIDFSGLV